MEEAIGERAGDFGRVISKNTHILETLGDENHCIRELVGLIEALAAANITNVEFDPTLMRGFDYYTGIVFEVFDTDSENNRSVFGGGRYDDLLDIFGAKKVPAFGFGAGDVTARDFLETHGLMPEYKSSANVAILLLKPELAENARQLAEKLRQDGLNVSVDLSGKKIGDQAKSAHKQKIPYVIAVGDDEIKTGLYPVKQMESGEEKKLKMEEISPSILDDKFKK